MATESEMIEIANGGVMSLLKHVSVDSTASGGKWAQAKVDSNLRLKIFDSSTGISCKLFKAVIEIPYSLQSVLAVILDLQSRMKWDGNIADLQQVLLKTSGDGRYLAFRSATKQVGPISGRDFVDAVFIGPLASLPTEVFSAAPSGLSPASLVNGGCGCAAGHPSLPETSSFVRGYNYPSGWVLEPISGPTETGPGAPAVPTRSDGWTRIHYVVQSDLKGWLPSAIVNASMIGMFSSFFTDMLKYMASK